MTSQAVPAQQDRSFQCGHLPHPIRQDLPDAYRTAWATIARPGCWWTGVERVAIAEHVRGAGSCTLCAKRKAAISPFSNPGAHDPDPILPASAVEAVHRVTTDASRLTQSWLRDLESQGLSAGQYVELLGVVVAVTSIDAFHHALGIALEPLPTPANGVPSGYQPEGLGDRGGWVPMLGGGKIGRAEADLFAGLPIVPNVLAAMSMVPDGVRMTKTVSAAQYLDTADVGNPAAAGDRALTRAQIELVAGRVSALNECFY